MNQFGSYGSQFSSVSVRNEFGTYGSAFSTYSANNQFAASPPIIYKNGIAFYYLTINSFQAPGVTLAAIDASCTFFSGSPDLPSGPTPPGPPLTVIAADGESTTELAVVWSPVSTATIYNVYLGETLDSLQYLGSTQFTSTPITGLLQGVVYYVGVTASNAAGESATFQYDTGFLARSFTVTPDSAGPGQISPAASVEVIEGGTAVFTLTPDATAQLTSVTGSCGGALQDNVFTTSQVSEDCSVVATFEAQPVDSEPESPMVSGAEGDIDTVVLTVSARGDGGQPITTYRGSCASSLDSVDGESQTSTVRISGLQADTDYECTATVENVVGESLPSSPVLVRIDFIPSGLPIWMIYEAVK
ncbi:fibronectin type III domain-containing protein [Congregibacter sp.]|nr:fibronectin type III domain-containing protein [Congregibacter sp.]MDA8962186.1 fibronectin type III domain-containing protein [Congregibacter sp.]